MEDPPIEDLTGSRRRLVQAADADRRWIERELHDGPQQQLVALAVNVQRARLLVEEDPVAAGALLDEIRRDVTEALDALRDLAHRIHPPLLAEGGLRTALRSAAAGAGVPTRVEVPPSTTVPPEIAGTVYRCFVDVLAHVGDGAQTTITVHEQEGTLVFDIAAAGSGWAGAADEDLVHMRDRVEALGGRLTIEADPGHDFRVSGSLPLSG